MADIILKAMPFDSNEILDPVTGETTYDREAYSRDLANWLRTYISNGILVPGGNVLGSQLQVLYKAGLTCTVKAGAVCINGRTGWLEVDTDVTVGIGGAQPRIDLVVAELNIPNDRGIYIKLLEGTPAAAPEAPALIQTEDVYQIPLAQVRINAGQATIYGVTDERPNYLSNVTIGIKPPTGMDAETIALRGSTAGIYGLISGTDGFVENALVVANNRMNEIFTQVMRLNLRQNLTFYNYDNLIMDALATNGNILSSSLDYVSNSLTGKLLNPTLATDEVLKINNGGSTETARRGPTVQWKFPITVPSTGYITKIEISGFSTYDGWTRGLSAEFYTNNGGELGSLLRSATASVSWGNGSVAYTKTLVLPEAIYAEAGTSIFVVVTMNSGSSVLSSLYYTNGGTASIQYRMGTTGAWTTEVSGVTPYCKLYMASTFTASIVTKLIDVPLHDREIYTGFFTALPPSLKHNIYRSVDGIAFLAIMMDRVEVFSAINKFCIKHVLEANIVDSKIPNSVSSLVTFKGYGAILNYGV